MVIAATLNIYRVYGLSVDSTKLLSSAVVTEKVSPVEGTTRMVYCRMMPFLSSVRGGCQVSCTDVELSVVTVKLVGGPEGTAVIKVNSITCISYHIKWKKHLEYLCT